MHYVTFYTAFDQYFQSVYPAVDMSVCVQNTTFPRSAGGGIKSHLVTALVIPPQNKCFGGILESACPSVHMFICVQITTFCHSAGRGIKSHSVTPLVFFRSCPLAVTET